MGTLIGRWFATIPTARRHQLSPWRPSIDLDGTDIEVYGRKKEAVAWNHEGRRVGRAHPATWAEAGLVLAGDLGSGRDDPRPRAPGLIARVIANLPEGLGRPRVRADAGYFDAKVAHGALDAGADFAIAAKRNTAAWRSVAAVAEEFWEDCFDMPARRRRSVTTSRPAGPRGPEPWSAGCASTRRGARRSPQPTASHDPPRPARPRARRRGDRHRRVQLHLHQPRRERRDARVLVP